MATFNSSGPRVLVVDDVDEMRTLIHRALSARGYQVDVAASLAQARALDPARYDAVLVDAGLGREHGVDLIEALRSANPAAAGRCLVMTGGSADTIPAGVPRLVKPFHIAQLLEALRALQRPPARPARTRNQAQPQDLSRPRDLLLARTTSSVGARPGGASAPARREFTGSAGPGDAGTGPHAGTRAGLRTSTVPGPGVPRPASAPNGRPACAGRPRDHRASGGRAGHLAAAAPDPPAPQPRAP